MIIAIIIILISILIISKTAFFGKNIFEKLLAINSINNFIIALIIIFSLSSNNSSFIDIALIYATLSYISLACFLKYFRQEQW